MVVSPEEKALTRISADLIKNLKHCISEVADRLFAEDLIPEDLNDRVASKDPSATREVVQCLIGRIKLDSKEFVKVVEILQGVSFLQACIEKLKKCYSEW